MASQNSHSRKFSALVFAAQERVALSMSDGACRHRRRGRAGRAPKRLRGRQSSPETLPPVAEREYRRRRRLRSRRCRGLGRDAELLLRHVGDRVADAQRRRGCGRWSVEYVQAAVRARDLEVVEHLTVASERLRANAAAAFAEIVSSDFGHEAPQRRGEALFAAGAQELLQPDLPVAQAELPEAGVEDAAPTCRAG